MDHFFLFLLRVLEVLRERSHLLQNLKGFGSVKLLANEKTCIKNASHSSAFSALLSSRQLAYLN